MDISNAQILYISAKLAENHSAQETVWVEDIAKMVNACATKVLRELTVV
jgi:hypothetical protein